MSDPSRKTATYAVRFTSYDDFLVEYTDHLRQNRLMLPLAIVAGTAVRLKVHLPDGNTLYLAGTVCERDAASGQSDDRVPVSLHALSVEQQADLERCLQSFPGAMQEDAEAEAAGDGATLLLVDDSVTFRLELGDALRERGFRVRAAENGLIALSAALKRTPDVILTDVGMPVMDGWTFLRMARSRQRLAHVPIVLLTNLDDDESRLHGYRLGVDDYLAKTLPHDEIAARLHAVLARRIRAHETTHGLKGDVQHVRLGSLLAFLESERRTGELRLDNGCDDAVLSIVDGALCGVENLGRYDDPLDRVFELLGWKHGEFEFIAQPPSGAGNLEPTPLTYLLMEHARRTDESTRTPE